jgi:hypothetical protein
MTFEPKRIDERHLAGRMQADGGDCSMANEDHESIGKSRFIREHFHFTDLNKLRAKLSLEEVEQVVFDGQKMI